MCLRKLSKRKTFFWAKHYVNSVEAVLRPKTAMQRYSIFASWPRWCGAWRSNLEIILRRYSRPSLMSQNASFIIDDIVSDCRYWQALTFLVLMLKLLLYFTKHLRKICLWRSTCSDSIVLLLVEKGYVGMLIFVWGKSCNHSKKVHSCKIVRVHLHLVWRWNGQIYFQNLAPYCIQFFKFYLCDYQIMSQWLVVALQCFLQVLVYIFLNHAGGSSVDQKHMSRFLHLRCVHDDIGKLIDARES